MNVEIDIEDAPDAIPAPPFEGRVEYKNVGFGYEEDKKVLEHINLTVEPGQTVAFVGPSGVGKTTLVNLLPRFYDLKEGKSWSMEQTSIVSPYNRFAVKSVSCNKMCSSLMERFAKMCCTEDSMQRTKKLTVRLSKAKLKEVIEDLEDGVDTHIGERGVKLSGGQKQRLSIARIFLKNPSILILDEATSALDTQTEKFIQQSFDELAKEERRLLSLTVWLRLKCRPYYCCH